MRRLAGFVALSALMLVGCSSNPDITFGAADTSGAPIQIPAGDVSASDWPDACTLLSEDEVKAILPQASGFTHEPRKITFLPRMEFIDGQLHTGSSEDLPNGGCEYRLTLPDEYSIDGNSWIMIDLPVISDEASVSSYYDEQRQGDVDHGVTDLGSSWGPSACYLSSLGSSTTAHCRNGRFYFEVWGGTTVTKAKDAWQDKVLSQVVRTLAAKTR